jgi:hypothetical protein
MLTLMLKRLGPPPSTSETDAEFLDGAFLFHDGEVKFLHVLSFPKVNLNISVYA